MYVYYFRFLFILIGSSVSASLGMKYQGTISQSCLYQYQKLLTAGDPPPRHYKYFHEMMPPHQAPSTSLRIIGGRWISIKQAPYQVLYGLYCGGAILAPSWVVTAAHCTEEETFVLAGSSFRSTTQKYPICAHFTHPLWFRANKKHSHDWDYQLLLLETPIRVSPQARPIALATREDLSHGVVAVSGWGHVRPKGKMVDLLHQVRLSVIPRRLCRSLDSDVYQITPRMFCAGYLNGTKDSCQGDSGGPAVARGRLAGLVSFGAGCALPGRPGVYAALLPARPWIREVTSLPL